MFTLEGFWRLVLGIGEVLAGGRAATRPSPNRVNYNTKSMSRSSRAGEMVGRTTLYWFLQYKINLQASDPHLLARVPQALPPPGGGGAGWWPARALGPVEQMPKAYNSIFLCDLLAQKSIFG